MKSFIVVMSLLLLGCISSTSKDSTEKSNNDCINKSYYGEIEICLPEITGMIESSKMSFPLIDSLISITSTQKVQTFAVYIEDNLYKEYKSGILDKGLNNYFSITAIEPMKNQKSDLNTMKEFSTLASSGIINDEWNNIKGNVEKYLTNLEFGVPVLVDKYSINTNTLTLITINKIQNSSETRIGLTAMNLILVKDRILFIHYNIPYGGNNSLEKLKGLNDYVVLRFLDVN